MATTIHEVAKRSGVSVATVSRVFNGYSDVSAATRERVLAAAAALEYAPSAAARTLVGGRSQLIGLVVFTGAGHPDVAHPFFQDVLSGLDHGLGELGYDLLIFASELSGGTLHRARRHRVDGVVLWGVSRSDAEVLRLEGSELPLVGIDVELAGDRATWVASDNAEGARLAVRHLRGLGHERIATITGMLETQPGAERLDGFREEAGAVPDGYVQVGDFYAGSGETAMRALLDLPEPPTAVFAASDLMALGAINAVRQRGLRVPGDVAIVGFDDIQVAPLVRPPLTTIRQDKVGLGTAAARALVGRIERRATEPPRRLPVELVVRESCGAVSVAA